MFVLFRNVGSITESTVKQSLKNKRRESILLSSVHRGVRLSLRVKTMQENLSAGESFVDAGLDSYH